MNSVDRAQSTERSVSQSLVTVYCVRDSARELVRELGEPVKLADCAFLLVCLNCASLLPKWKQRKFLSAMERVSPVTKYRSSLRCENGKRGSKKKEKDREYGRQGVANSAYAGGQ